MSSRDLLAGEPNGGAVRRAQIVGWGKYLPDEVLTNEHLSGLVDTSDEWIVSRTGVRERRRASPRESTSSLAIKAAWSALQVADLAPTHLDLVVVATMTPDYMFPATAYIVQDGLGAAHAAAFDLNTGCTGFVYGLTVAAGMISAGIYRNALVIGAEVMTRFMDYADRGTCVLFGDGAGAVVLEATDALAGVLSSSLGGDGSGGALIQQPAGGSRHPASHETVDARMHFMKMNGNEVYKFAVSAMARATVEAVRRAGLDVQDVDLLIPHQANLRIIQSSAKTLGLPMDRVYVNLDRYGNTSAASVPIALCEAVEEGRIKPSDKVVLVAFGTGLSWGAVCLQWGNVVAPVARPWWRMALQSLRHQQAAVRSAARRAGRKIDAWWPHRNGPLGG